MRSKALKSSWLRHGIEREIPLHADRMLRAWIWITNYIRCDIIYPLYRRLRASYAINKRMYAWASQSKEFYNWDGGVVYKVMAFQLEKVRHSMLTGPHILEDEEMDALQETIKICHRLYNDRYDDVYYRQHEKKWGKLITTTEPVPSADGITRYYSCKFARPNAVTEEEKAQEREEAVQCYTKGRLLFATDHDRLNELMKTYIRRWWS